MSGAPPHTVVDRRRDPCELADHEDMPMQKSIAAAAVALIFSTSMLASAGNAEAYRHHHYDRGYG